MQLCTYIFRYTGPEHLQEAKTALLSEKKKNVTQVDAVSMSMFVVTNYQTLVLPCIVQSPSVATGT